MAIDRPYHEGEISVQERAGLRDVALLNAKGIQPRIIPAAHPFLTGLRYFVLGRADADQACEATVLFGDAGFLSAQAEGSVLSVRCSSNEDRSSDPVLGPLREGDRVGGLAIDLASRRRLRINGVVESVTAEEVRITVRESYANCPKYIQKRIVEDVDGDVHVERSGPHANGIELTDEQRARIRRADTFFIVTVNPSGYADASHRGGSPGFVRIEDDGTIVVEDYAGNGMFNTLGNLASNPRAALVFWDFEKSRERLLHLAGRATLHFDDSGRRFRFQTEHWTDRTVAIPFRTRLLEYSRFNPEL
ncbi:MAG: pyridoxamine 5'-phosphate oxidase family protein [Polyangiaceae bacterium]|nr:pyridoxamine 5'-phosphate oxidase family protein [Polyangiaceae bacterium]